MESERPQWLALYETNAQPLDVARCWFESLCPEDQEHARKDGATWRTVPRKEVIRSQCPRYLDDSATGFQYIGAVMRSVEEVLGIPPPARSSAFQRPAADSATHTEVPPGDSTAAATENSTAVGDMAPKLAVKPRQFRPPQLVRSGDGRPGTLGLWWSDFETAARTEELVEECGITHRLNTAIECVDRFGADDACVTEHAPMQDRFEHDEELHETWKRQLLGALDILRGWRDQGAVANVNCQMGKNRSGAVVVMWLCKECGRSLEEAIEYVRSITPLACANPNLVEALADALNEDVVVPLNPGRDDGGWICISPPTSPRAGGTQAFEDTFAQLSQRLEAVDPGDLETATMGAPLKQEQEEGLDDVD
uniref:Tyrosine specific protein phosphatases domain-containing protein n=1 Tax=Noctiluca scintillans TaxID=2966 RepID=A0A7S1AEV3_NOCSC|mmetsp:Transcript_43383/g.114276  ORF Transcript_43383/g.114276 Transcript_43383/m.114276 type:complete len:366 (+) Transcript_43383:59-1156(+)|eukprot:CAMPEP_0194483588 /NCGR_PEP_ID=MMETSP0253-20130528/5136_1 /TAXON_ID=2966 /ORGANISM="Noctiluca scintillans" /LENGTH=365 /DNA_ID=CAMNT_0039323259 /DNA_START=36 /DNA_END=1133 /DNA_ORIENTATION=+